MIYTYQDGTELPIQRDFIQDLKNYVECLGKVLPLENSIIERKDEDKENITHMNRKLMILSKFRDDLLHALPLNEGSEELEILKPCVSEIIDVCDKNIRKSRESLEFETNQIKKESAVLIKSKEIEILKTLSPFLVSSVYGAKRAYVITQEQNGLSGMFFGYISGLQYNYQLHFNDDRLTVQKLLGKLNVPHMAKTGLFMKESKPRVSSLSDYFVQNIQYDDPYNFLLELENKKKIIKIIRKNGNFSIFDDGQDITADTDLSALIEEAELQKIPEKITDYIKKNVASFELKEIFIDEDDAILNNLIFDCMKVIAGQYGSIVHECIRKSSIKSEISIKIQMEDGTRNEKYISKEELYSKLANLGGEGLEIAGIIGVEASKGAGANRYLIV
ncbi:chromosome segregation ATPase [Methanolapillus millepedarum]|uniref:Chromosome segregation ATPase n=1 Tax=Methanolapillus millepedarum TaxID=3028296 RepID=A0AA96ZUA2_9EURY|nr:hypothetical protein MsAc7_10420 [Methanosarcinaceae archaeon Ac7]